MGYSESIYMRIHRLLTWKRIVAFNILLVLVLVVPFSLRLAQEDTENRSEASDEEVEIQEPPANYPDQPPAIERVKTFYGKTGDSIVILGSNFGDYQWASSLNIGSSIVQKEDVIAWSNSVIEAQIPESARSGQVRVTVSGVSSQWEGVLYVYNEENAVEVGLRVAGEDRGSVYLGKSASVARGVIEIAYTNDPISISALPKVEITNLSNSVDSLGRKVVVEFRVIQPLGRANEDILIVDYSGIGKLEISRVELYTAASQLIDAYSLPLSVATEL